MSRPGREAKLLAEWEEGKAKEAASGGSSSTQGQSSLFVRRLSSFLRALRGAVVESGPAVEASMNASIWKIRVKPGDVVKSVDDVVRLSSPPLRLVGFAGFLTPIFQVVVLEAMKSEIEVAVEEEEFVGKKVKSVAVKEGDVISAGQKLVIFE